MNDVRDVFQIGARVSCFPVIHGSGDFAVAIRRKLIDEQFTCVAIALPHSFRDAILAGIDLLPRPTIALQEQQFELGNEGDEEDDEGRAYNFVPIDPCQPVISAVRAAVGERIPVEFVDLETANYKTYSQIVPDPYALKSVTPEQFATAMLPSIPRPTCPQRIARIQHMARRLREISIDYPKILFVCSLLDWPWVHEAYLENQQPTTTNDSVEPAQLYDVEDNSRFFMLGELPFITQLYERARSELLEDSSYSIDGVKELLVSARDAYLAEFQRRARKITPHMLRTCLKYIRNLSLIENRMTPDLATIILAAKQIAGDQYALHVLEKSKEYLPTAPTNLDTFVVGIGQGRFAFSDEAVGIVSRLEGPPLVWSNLELLPRPDRSDMEKWKQGWNPFQQCSWPPEDEKIENFRAAVFDRARALLGADLAKTEKFTTSVKDGIDIRDTLRHWYEGEIYVKVLPPNLGDLDAAVMLFDAPSDPRSYPWRTTWYAEHKDESTLAFFATNFRDQPIGPGICVAHYGGAMFIFPPVVIRDIWTDPNLDFAETLEERLIAAACMYAKCPHVAIVSAAPPGQTWKQIAKRFKKKLLHVPLGSFSDSTVQQLRIVHVLNGKEVRSYAAHFIRRA